MGQRPVPTCDPRLMTLEHELSLPEGFLVGHWTCAPAETGCTVVICPRGTRGGVEVRGGGTGTRDLEPLSPLANAEGPTAVLLTGGGAYRLFSRYWLLRWGCCPGGSGP